MNLRQVFDDYMALKYHFFGKYDYFKYKGKIWRQKLTEENGKLFYEKLAERPDYFDFVLANMAYENTVPWVGDMVHQERYEDNYTRFKAVHQRLHYQFAQDLKKLKNDFDSNFVVDNNKLPSIVTLYRRREIELETLVILCAITGCLERWDEEIKDTILWPKISVKIKKYMPFVKYDEKKIKAAILSNFS